VTTGIPSWPAAALLPSLLVCALAPTQGQSFPIGQGMAHALLAAIGVLAKAVAGS